MLQDHSTLAKTQQVGMTDWLQKNIPSSNWNTNIDTSQLQLFARYEHIIETSLSTVCLFYFKRFYSWNWRVSLYQRQMQEWLKINCLRHPKKTLNVKKGVLFFTRCLLGGFVAFFKYSQSSVYHWSIARHNKTHQAVNSRPSCILLSSRTETLHASYMEGWVLWGLCPKTGTS